ncbi:MAG: hypothetical protein JSS83_20785 [Cyanobacteria bacterium SZAS LIN-3]|nr:hypothetical protein [Cyanobacteria bacterium SZAS LIN-3]MBS2010584.1 hypothetical protein [Cyanobacteria bacterium SZAS TMP-1]
MHSSDRFINAIKSGQRKPTAHTARGCYGRIVRTLFDKPRTLAEEPDRRVVMLMGPSALRTIVGHSAYEMLVQIGHTREYIAVKLAQGYKYHLVVFHRPDSEMRLATWKNTLDLVGTLYPQLAHLLKAARRELKTTSFAEFEAQAGFSLAEVDHNGPGDERYMTAERLLASDGSALSVRRFLYHVTRLTELYTGDGYTCTHDGKRGVREYIMANRAISDLQESRTLELEVTLPTGP